MAPKQDSSTINQQSMWQLLLSHAQSVRFSIMVLYRTDNALLIDSCGELLRRPLRTPSNLIVQSMSRFGHFCLRLSPGVPVVVCFVVEIRVLMFNRLKRWRAQCVGIVFRSCFVSLGCFFKVGYVTDVYISGLCVLVSHCAIVFCFRPIVYDVCSTSLMFVSFVFSDYMFILVV